ncbi:MAG: prepilin-type N-terminal cleavage/methylation domain-containing protein [Proteobacteria bacterium]|jgi:prepilin-type N-terminal cleavage/methylation domain-containing protein|nr:prepilin-type N-terminal cleavage/methylation domain-containing protein [Pseudomonadota bacterium]MDA1302274.1 prepilin-type N-terminal cleavage/methylation domain-containing protein [Pseudomonadota bacterium]
MAYRRNIQGFTMFELLIVVAVIGIVSAVAVPAYRSYIQTANMTKVTAHFEQGVRVAQNAFAKDKTRVAIGIPASAPDTTEDWIALLNRNGVQAPGGGPAYIPSTNNRNEGRGDPETGAIGVLWRAAREAREKKDGSIRPGTEAQLTLWRPLYLSLVEQRAQVTGEGVEITIQRKSL